MKKILLAVCGALIIALVVFFTIGRDYKPFSAAKLLPPDVLLTIEQHELDKMVKDFQGSRLGKNIAAIDVTALAEGFGLGQEVDRQLNKLKKEVDEFLKSLVYREFFAEEFTVALFPFDEIDPYHPYEEFEKHCLIISRPAHDTAMLKLASALVSTETGEETKQYGKHSIKRYQLDEDRRLSVVTIEGLVVAALNERLVRKVIDQYDSDAPCLAEEVDYIELDRALPRSHIFTYLSVPLLKEMAVNLSNSLKNPHHERFVKELEQWKGWRAAGYGAEKIGDIITDRGMILYDSSSLSEQTRAMINAKPTVDAALAIIPEETFFYYWTNSVNSRLILDMYLEQADQNGQPRNELMATIDALLKDEIGMSTEEILASLGEELSFLLAPGKKDQALPLPGVAMFLKTGNRENIEKMISRLVAKYDIPLQSLVYKETQYHTWGAAPGGAVQPAYGFIDDHLVVVSRKALFKQVIDTRQGKPGLAASKDFLAVGEKLKSENNSITFCRTEKLMGVLKDLILWGGGFAALRGPDAAARTKLVTDGFLLPLLDGLAMYSLIGSHSRIEPDRIIIESTTRVTP